MLSYNIIIPFIDYCMLIVQAYTYVDNCPYKGYNYRWFFLKGRNNYEKETTNCNYGYVCIIFGWLWRRKNK